MTRLESIKSNAFLLGLNMNKATKEQKIQWLCQIIDNETDKPEDEIDFALIGECSAYLRELSDKATEATKEQKQRILQQIKARHNQTATKSAKVLRPRWKTARKVVGIAIAAVLLLTLTLSVIAKVNGYSSAWEYIRENAKTFFNMSSGSKVKDGEITLTKHDGVVTYNSIEELLQTEDYDIMYPSDLPKNVEILELHHYVINKEHTVCSFVFTDTSISFAISTVHNIRAEDLEKCEVFKTTNMEFFIRQRADMSYQAIGYNGIYEYQISCNDYDTLTIIINGIRGLEK